MTSPLNPALYLLPWAGLANRMRGIDSSFSLCRKNGRALRAYWIKEPFCNIRFDDLFMPVVSEWVTIIDASPIQDLCYNIAKNRNFRIPAVFQNLKFGRCHRMRPQECQALADVGLVPDIFSKTDRVCYLGCGAQLVPPSNYDFLYKPRPEFEKAAIEAFESRDPKRCVGMHIRRGDHTRAMQRSPISLFFSEASRLLAAGDSDTIFLATDDATVKRDFLAAFPGKCWTRNAVLARDSMRGMKDAFVDMLVLSKCSRVFGCHASTFAETAAWMGHRPYTVLKSQVAEGDIQ